MTPFGNNSRETTGPFGSQDEVTSGPFGSQEPIEGISEEVQVSNGSLDEIIESFRNSGNFRLLGYADYLEELKRGLNQENLSNLSTILNKFSTARNNEEITRIMEELQEATMIIQNEINAVRDQVNQEEVILSDRFIDEIDLLGSLRSSIRDRLDASEDMTLEELLTAARDIELSGEINGQESWDAFFADLRDQVPESDLEEFDRQVTEFKTEESDLYESDIDTSSLGNSLDEQLANIESGAWDEQFESGTARINIDVESLLGDLTTMMGIDSSELSNLLEVGPYSSKESAVRTIYKLKLIFSEMEENGKNFLSYYYEYVNNTALWLSTEGGEQFLNGTIDLAPGGDSAIQTPFHYIYGALLATLGVVTGIVGNALPTGITLFFLGTPIESAWRRIKDKISVWIGDKGFAAPIRSVSNGIRNWSSWIGGQARAGLSGTISSQPGKLRRIGNIIRLAGGTVIWAPSKAADVLLGGLGSLVEGAERIHLDAANLLTDRILLVDGLSGGVGDSQLDNASSNEAIEVRSRIKMVALWRRIFEYEGNTQALDKLNKIAESSLFANSESFYIDLHRLIIGEVGNNSASARLSRFGIDISNIMLIPNKKERMVKLYLDYMERTSRMLGQIYNNVRFENNRETPNNSRIDLPENRAENYSDFVKDMLADIDFSLISDSDEQAREKMLLDFFREIERGGAGILSVDQIKFEIEKIVEGFLPNYKVIQQITQHRSTLTSGSNGMRNIEGFRQLVLGGDWYGTQADLDRVLSDIERTPATIHKPTIRNMEDVRAEGEALRAMSLRNNRDFGRITDINTYNPQLTLIDHLIQTGEMNGNITEIRRQLAALISNARDENLNIDYTIPEFNYAISQILAGKRFSDAGIGDFGTGIDLDTMIQDYRDFDTQIADIIERRVLNILPGQDQETRIRIVEQIIGDDSLGTLRRTDEFRSIVTHLDSEIRAEITSIQTQLEEFRTLRSTLFSRVISDPNSGESNNIGDLNREIQRKISDLETRLQNSLGRGTTVIDRANIVDTFPAEIVVLEQKLRTLEVDIEQYNSRNTPSTPEIESSSDTVITDETETGTEETVEETTTKPGTEYLGRNSNWGRGYDVFRLEILMRSDINISPDEFFADILAEEYSSRGELFEAMNQKLSDEGIDIQISQVTQSEELNFKRAYAEDVYTRYVMSTAGSSQVNEMTLNSIRTSANPLGLLDSIDISSVPSWDDITISGDGIEEILDGLREVRSGAWRTDGGVAWRTFLGNLRKAAT